MRKTIQSVDENPTRAKPLATKPPGTPSPYQTRTPKTLETRPTPTKANPPAFVGSNNRRKEQQKVEETKRVVVLKSEKLSNVQTNSPLPARPWTRLETTEEKRRLKPPFTWNLPSQSRLYHREAGAARITEVNKKATNSIKKESLPLIKLSKRVPTNPDLKITLAKSKKQAAAHPAPGFQASKKGNDAAGNTKLSNVTPANSRVLKGHLQSKLPPILKHSERQPPTTQSTASKSLKPPAQKSEKAPSTAGSFKFINSIPNETWSEDTSEKQSIPEARPTTPTHLLVSSEKADTVNRPTMSRRKRASKPTSEASLNPEIPMTPAELWEKIESFSSWLAETLNLDNNGNPVSKKSRQENSSHSKESTSTESLSSQLSSSSLTNSLQQKPSTRRHPRVVSTPQPTNFPSHHADIFYAVRKDVCKHFPGADINVSLEELRRENPSLANLPCFKDPMFFTSIKVPNNFNFANPAGIEHLLKKSTDLPTQKKSLDPPLNNSRSVESLKTAFRTFQLPSWAKECFSGDDEESETLKEYSDDYESSTLSPAVSVESLEASSRAVQSEVVNKILSLYAKTKSPAVSPPVCQTASKTNIPEAVPDAEQVIPDESLTKEPDQPP